ncbi:MAG TPA: hypothetical protein VMW72_22030 [Sedimentisphaerales bacterium]|nr:hypothetical protein [Sedimentisphaerales bacterium]
MSLIKNISFWIVICAILSAMSYFVNYLLTPESRKVQRNKVHIFFRKIFDSIDRTNFTDLQRLMVEYVIGFKNKIFGERILTRRMLVMSLICSQYLTLIALVLSNLIEDRNTHELNILSFIPLFPFVGFSFILGPGINVYQLLMNIGLFWNNFLFDFIAIVSTAILLKKAYEKKLSFSLAASIDVSLSYLLAYFCIILYAIMPPGSATVHMNFLTFIPDLWSGKVSYILYPTTWLFYSLTSFVPILLYMSVLLFFSLCKCLQYICAPLTEKCSETDGRTIFFTFGSAFAILLILLTAIKELIN